MIAELSEVQGAYNAVKGNGMLVTGYYVATFIGMIFAIISVLRTYVKSLAGEKPFETKALIEILYPVFLYTLVIGILPVAVSLLEAVFASVERGIINNIQGSSMIGDNLDVMVDQVEALEEDYKDVGTWDIGGQIGKHIHKPLVIAMTDLMAWIDQYLYSFALAARYVYLLLLEIIAPFAIISTLFPETKHLFWTWMKNMLVCYLMVPGFMVATFFVHFLMRIWSEGGSYGIMLMLFSIALKMLLYRTVNNKLSQLI